MDEREKRKSKLSFRTNIRPEIIIFTYRKTEEFIKNVRRDLIQKRKCKSSVRDINSKVNLMY